jgi:hypothetical protein
LPLLSPPRRVESIVNLQLLVYTKPCSTLFSSGDVMAFATRFVVPIAFSALVMLAGCGGGNGTSKPTPPPSGAFSSASLNGTYTFSVAGANGSGIFAMAGTFVACGCVQGTISSGTVDLNDPSGPAIAAAIGSNSTYRITSDGRGLARLFITIPGSAGTEIDIDFVLTSSSHGSVIRFDGFGTGSGTIDLQSNAVTAADLTATPYAFFLSGGDLNNLPVTTAGALSIGSTGTIITGVEDFNYNGTPSTHLALTGSITLASGTNPGQAALTTSGTTPRSLGFSVYVIDATHLKLIENDGQFVLIGDLLAQPSTSISAGTLAFTMSGLDSNNDLFVTGGVMLSDGASLLTDGAEDVNDAGLVDNGTSPAAPFAFNGSFSSTGGGRFQVSLTNYIGGTTFAAYPSVGGLLMLQVDSLGGGITAGIALPQQPDATISASQGYGLNLSGEDLGTFVEIDQVAEVKTTTSGMTGLVDQNDGGQFGTANVRGTYNVSTGFASATFNSGLPNLFFYPIDSSTSLLITADSTVAALGSFQIQSMPGSAAQASLHRASSVPMPRILPHQRWATPKGRVRSY